MKMKLSLIIFLSIVTLSSMFADAFTVDFISIDSKVTIHRSYELVNNYKTPSNGLIIETDNSTVLIDTAWNDEETNQIIQYIEKNINKPIIACIITHFHVDKCGGINAIKNNKIPIYMTDLTYSLIDKKLKGWTYITLNNGNLILDNRAFDIEYFGKAHSPDNIIVYYATNDLLFGGCLIKSLDSTNIGNTSDADLQSWPKVINSIKEKYKNVSIVIPSHGEYGGPELLEHTLFLLK